MTRRVEIRLEIETNELVFEEKRDEKQLMKSVNRQRPFIQPKEDKEVTIKLLLLPDELIVC